MIDKNKDLIKVLEEQSSDYFWDEPQFSLEYMKSLLSQADTNAIEWVKEQIKPKSAGVLPWNTKVIEVDDLLKMLDAHNGAGSASKNNIPEDPPAPAQSPPQNPNEVDAGQKLKAMAGVPKEQTGDTSFNCMDIHRKIYSPQTKHDVRHAEDGNGWKQQGDRSRSDERSDKTGDTSSCSPSPNENERMLEWYIKEHLDEYIGALATRINRWINKERIKTAQSERELIENEMKAFTSKGWIPNDGTWVKVEDEIQYLNFLKGLVEAYHCGEHLKLKNKIEHKIKALAGSEAKG